MTHSFWDGIEAVILDAVGTLIEPEPSVADVYLAAAVRQGVLLDRAEVRSRFGRHFRNDEVDESREPLITNEAIERARWRRIVGNVLPEVPDPNRAFEELWAHFAHADSWRCFPDVGPAVAALHGTGMPVWIASNFDARLRDIVAGRPEIARCRESLVISSEVGVRKPHPEFYRAAGQRLGLPLERILFVGDEPENDVLGPIRAGMRAVRLDRTPGTPADGPTLPDLAALIGARDRWAASRHK